MLSQRDGLGKGWVCMAFCRSSLSASDVWIIDSGASDHTRPSLSLFKNKGILNRPYFITRPNGNGKRSLVRHLGSLQLSADICLENVLCVPDFQFHLISLIKLTFTHP